MFIFVFSVFGWVELVGPKKVESSKKVGLVVLHEPVVIHWETFGFSR